VEFTANNCDLSITDTP